MKRIESEGSNFRSKSEERQEFKAVFFNKYKDSAGYMWTETEADMRSMQRDNPELKDMKIEDLMALRMWCTWDFRVFQEALDESKPPNATSLAYAKQLVSALHSLPEGYTYTGTVFTGHSQSNEWVDAHHRLGEVETSRRFFAGAETRSGAWKQGMNVELETRSVSGKRISLFSATPSEQEVLFPPGTRFRTDGVQHAEEGTIKIYQSEVVDGL